MVPVVGGVRGVAALTECRRRASTNTLQWSLDRRRRPGLDGSPGLECRGRACHVHRHREGLLSEQCRGQGPAAAIGRGQIQRGHLRGWLLTYRGHGRAAGAKTRL